MYVNIWLRYVLTVFIYLTYIAYSKLYFLALSAEMSAGSVMKNHRSTLSVGATEQERWKYNVFSSLYLMRDNLYFLPFDTLNWIPVWMMNVEQVESSE